jgi:hypothetical protein
MLAKGKKHNPWSHFDSGLVMETVMREDCMIQSENSGSDAHHVLYSSEACAKPTCATSYYR